MKEKLTFEFGDFYKALIRHHESKSYPLHMPGHKRNIIPGEAKDVLSEIRSLDITEIEGFDDLHAAEGLIKALQEKIAQFYGAKNSSILVNGSTGGILAAISACCKRGDLIIMARNSHKSAYNAVMINDLKAEYVYPMVHEATGICTGISPEDVKRSLIENPNAKAVYITSPTYEGVISDIGEIARIVHEYGIPLIVDEAHGAHFGIFDSEYGRNYKVVSAVAGNADIVIQSLHKTLPSFTQTGILHYCADYVDVKRLKKYLAVYQSSSPSYIFMAGIDRCFELLKRQGKELFERYEKRLDNFYQEMKELRHLHILTGREVMNWPFVYGFDYGKLIVATDGKRVSDSLQSEYGLVAEMSSISYLILMTSLFDSDEGFERLKKALFDIDKGISDTYEEKGFYEYPKAIIRKTIGQSVNEAVSDMNICEGKISQKFMYAYPPGIPLVAPGELYTKEISAVRDLYLEKGITIRED